MGIFSSLFSSNADNKEIKLHQIEHIKNTIEIHKKSIENEKMNMSRYRASNAPAHYQESGKRKITHYKSLITKCKEDIKRLKG